MGTGKVQAFLLRIESDSGLYHNGSYQRHSKFIRDNPR